MKIIEEKKELIRNFNEHAKSGAGIGQIVWPAEHSQAIKDELKSKGTQRLAEN